MARWPIREFPTAARWGLTAGAMPDPRPLPPAFRRRLEAAYGACLGHVRLHEGPAAARIAAEAGGAACAVGGRDVFLGPVPPRRRALVLAHEVAHLVQQRRGVAQGPMPDPEAEAHAAAHAALAGRPFRIHAAIDPRVPACWGEAGHYYTVYFVALAAGVDPAIAARLAFWTQMADEIDELNAVPAGIAMVLEDAKSIPSDRWAEFSAHAANVEIDIWNHLLSQVPGGGSMMKSRAYPAYERSEQYWTWRNVQRGLHALTGRECEAETKRRVAFSGACRPLNGQEFEFGVSLHPLGDSFAHRDDKAGTMFAPPLGHGPHGHEPDVLGNHRRVLYRRYVGTLHQVITRGFGTANAARVSEADSVAALDTIIPPAPSPDTMRRFRSGYEAAAYVKSLEPDENRQIAQIRELAQSLMKLRLSAYEPERFESSAFGKFTAPPSIPVPGALVQRALVLARDWS
jgi:hypothetical protein